MMDKPSVAGSGEDAKCWDVLVVDDVPVVRDGVRRVLEEEGMRVATVSNGAEALDHPAVGTCRLAICDLMLPDLSGVDLVVALRRARPGLPVILITGYATAQRAREALEIGVSEFLAKPFDATELLQVVRRILQGKGTDAKES